MKIVGSIAVMLIIGLAILVLAGGIGLISWIGMMIVGIFGSVVGLIFNILGMFVAMGLKVIFTIAGIGLLIFVIWKVSTSGNDKY